MATSAKDVFDLAMGIIDELSESGVSDTSDTREYKNRTRHILNVLQGELYFYSDRYSPPVNGKRSIAIPILDFESEIASLDDYICRTVLPYGLAAHLLMDENPTVANTCLQLYEQLKAGLSKGLPSTSCDIEDIYGGFAHCEFGHW